MGSVEASQLFGSEAYVPSRSITGPFDGERETEALSRPVEYSAATSGARVSCVVGAVLCSPDSRG